MFRIFYILSFSLLLTLNSIGSCIEENPTGTKFEDSDPRLEEAVYYFRNKNYQSAFYEFYQIHLKKGLYKKNTINVQNDVATARSYIAWMYQNGFCLEKNYQKAADWYELSINTTKTVDIKNSRIFGLLSELYLIADYELNLPEKGIQYLSKAFSYDKTFKEDSRELRLLSDLINNIHNLYNKDKIQFIAYSLAFVKYFDFDYSNDDLMKSIRKNTSFDDRLSKNGLKNKFYQIKFNLGKELFNGENTEKDLYLASKMILDAGRNGKINEAGIYAAEVNEKGLGDYEKNLKYALDWIEWSLKGTKDKNYITKLNAKKDNIIKNLSDNDIKDIYGYKNRKSWEFGKKYGISQSYIDEINKFNVVDDKTLSDAIERGIDEDYLSKSFSQNTKLSKKQQGIFYQFLVDEKEASDKIFTSASDIKEKRDKENAKRAEEDKKRRAKERAKKLAANPYKIVMSCEHFDSHTNINACLLGDIDSKIKITKSGSSYIYQPWDLQRLGTESYEGLEFNISSNSSVGASNVSEYLILKIKVYDRITNKLIKTVSAGYLDYAYVKLK